MVKPKAPTKTKARNHVRQLEALGFAVTLASAV
jgi:hypothetical protein